MGRKCKSAKHTTFGGTTGSLRETFKVHVRRDAAETLAFDPHVFAEKRLGSLPVAGAFRQTSRVGDGCRAMVLSKRVRYVAVPVLVAKRTVRQQGTAGWHTCP